MKCKHSEEDHLFVFGHLDQYSDTWNTWDGAKWDFKARLSKSPKSLYIGNILIDKIYFRITAVDNLFHIS